MLAKVLLSGSLGLFSTGLAGALYTVVQHNLAKTAQTAVLALPPVAIQAPIPSPPVQITAVASGSVEGHIEPGTKTTALECRPIDPVPVPSTSATIPVKRKISK